jgi:integrase
MAWVYPSGETVFVFRYTPVGGGARRKMRLGRYGEGGITLAQAYDIHRQAQRDLENKLDPIEEQKKRLEATRRAREEKAGAYTVASLVEQFVHRKLRAERWDESSSTWVRDPKNKTKARKRHDVAAYLLGYAPPDALEKKRRRKGKPVATLISQLGNVKAQDVTKRQLIAFLDSIVDRGSPVAANRTFALLKQLFTWATAKDLIPASPMAGIERPGGDERPRDRILAAAEIRTLWVKLETADMAEPTKIALKLLLVTAQRRGELTLASWSHFDLDGKLWTIPVELLKSSHARRNSTDAHFVPLSSLAVDLLRRLAVLTSESPHVLPAHASKKRRTSERDETRYCALHPARSPPHRGEFHDQAEDPTPARRESPQSLDR